MNITPNNIKDLEDGAGIIVSRRELDKHATTSMGRDRILLTGMEGSLCWSWFWRAFGCQALTH